MEVLLDTNFIISSVKKKIDFISELESMGFKVILPREVFQELKDLRLKVQKSDKSAIDLALKLFESKKIKKTTIGHMKVDKGLIEKGRQGFYIATLDKGIRRCVPNRIIISNSKNSLIIDRE